MIKYPGHEIAIWSVIWMLAGGIVSYSSFQAGKTAVGIVFAVLPVASAMIWLGIRPAKWLLIAYFAMATIGGLLMLFNKGFELRMAAQLVGAAYSIFVLLQWNGGPGSD